MKHFKSGNQPDLNYDSPIMGGVSEEDKEYFNKLNDGKSILNHDDGYESYSDDDSGTFRHFQD